jgi:hypothetical protein
MPQLRGNEPILGLNMKLSTSPIEFPFTTSIITFEFC